MISPMTELEAVNEMLMSIGQAPVSTLEVTGIKDVNIAKAELQKVSRRVQSQGWNWNSDESFPLTPDVDGIITIPAGAIKVDPTDKYVNYVQRRHPAKGLALYSKDDRTFTFASAVDCNIVWAFGFEDLPETARCYIATAAGRKFQSRVVGSRILDAFQAEDEAKAWALLVREERASRDTNLFRKNPGLQAFNNRSM